MHFNAGGGRGGEVYTYKGRQYQYALDVCANISSALGIPNRGVKEGTGLYVIRKTKDKKYAYRSVLCRYRRRR
nr:N-acetylmuramoyl-L-alanine amidase [Clostridium cuniculi]